MALNSQKELKASSSSPIKYHNLRETGDPLTAENNYQIISYILNLTEWCFGPWLFLCAGGFIKMVVSSSGLLLGATVVAPNAGEIASELGLAVAQKLKLQDVMDGMGRIRMTAVWWLA